jgi:hypothetical protein
MPGTEKQKEKKPTTSPKFRLWDVVEVSEAEGQEAFYNGCRGTLIGITYCVDEVMRAYLVRFDIEWEKEGIVHHFKEIWLIY